MRTGIRLTVTLLLCCGCAVSVVNAAEWKLDPRIRFQGGYNDNLRFTADDELSSTELALTPGAKFSYETPSSGVSGDLYFLFRRFVEESDFDDNNAALDLRSHLQGERSRTGFNVNLVRDTTLESELEETGFAFDRINRLRARFTPNWVYQFGPRTSMSASYTYSLVDYDEKDTGYFDYTSSGGQLSLSRVLTEKTTGSITAGHTFTDNENSVKSRYSYLRAGASYRFSETLSFGASAGASHSESEFTRQSIIPIFVNDVLIGFTVLPEDAETSNDGVVFSASINKKFLRGHMSLTADRDITDAVSGALIEVTRYGLNNLYRFSETLSGELRLAATDSETTNGVGSSLSRDYYEVMPKLSWKFKKFWSISCSYRYSKQTSGSSSGDAVRNAAYLTLDYDWPRIAVSR